MKVTKDEFERFIFKNSLAHIYRVFNVPSAKKHFSSIEEHYGNYSGDVAKHVKHTDGSEDFYIQEEPHTKSSEAGDE